MASAEVIYVEPVYPPVKEVVLTLTPDEAVAVAAKLGRTNSSVVSTFAVTCVLSDAVEEMGRDAERRALRRRMDERGGY